MRQAPPTHSKEDISSEQAHFEAYYGQNFAAGQYRAPWSKWDERALYPEARPLDYWEYAFYLLGDLRGRRVLDLGCGGGWITRLLAAKGAAVCGCDVSLQGCRLTREKLKAHDFPAGSIGVMDGHALAFRDESFDAVFMAGVLHHMNIAKVASELRRVLKPGGRFVCYEPLRYGRIMWALRQVWLRLHGLAEYEHTEHEEELKVGDLAPFIEIFPTAEIRAFSFLAKTNRLKNRWGPTAITLRWIDYIILSAVPFFRRYCTTVLCYAEKS